MKIFKSTMLLIPLVLVACATAPTHDQLDKDVIAGNTVAAKVDLQRLKENEYYYDGREAISILDGYQATVSYLEASENFQTMLLRYNPDTLSQENLNEIKTVYDNIEAVYDNSVRSVFNATTSQPLGFPQNVIDSLNLRNAELLKTYNEIVQRTNSAIAMRKKGAELADQKITQQAQMQEEELERHNTIGQSNEKLREKRWKEKIAQIDRKARANGYKGLYSVGIAQFIFKVQHLGKINEGLDYIFWSGVSSTDKALDSSFKLQQIVDGYGIYSLTSSSISMTIAVPATEDVIDGQALPGSYYLYVGNKVFDTVIGTQKILPEFKPVILK